MNAYDILGVLPNAELSEVKKAYRKLALEFHPDKNKSPGAEDKFKRINEAWTTLSSPEKKQAHDRNLHFQNMNSGQGQWEQFSPREPIFEHFFRNHGFGGSWEDVFGGREQRASKYQAHAVLSLEDIASGIAHKVSLNGEEFAFNIPAGVQNGEVLKIQLTDFTLLEVTITVTPHSDFIRRGLDIETQITIPLQTALAGGEVRAPSLRGSDINLRIPSGVNSHAKLRVKGGGIQRGRSIGNCFYEIKVQIPKLEPTDLVDVLKTICKN